MSTDILAELSGLHDTLNFHMARHGVLVGNIVNADTPGYVPKELVQNTKFSQVLVLTLEQATSHEQHIGAPSNGQGLGDGMAYQEVTQDQALGADGNGVHIEQAMAQVTANRLRYEAALELTRRQLTLLRYAATDGGRA